MFVLCKINNFPHGFLPTGSKNKFPQNLYCPCKLNRLSCELAIYTIILCQSVRQSYHLPSLNMAIKSGGEWERINQDKTILPNLYNVMLKYALSKKNSFKSSEIPFIGNIFRFRIFSTSYLFESI